MKYLLFTDNLGAGGAQRQLVGLAVLLKLKGHAVKVCYYQSNDFYNKFLEDNGVPHELINNSEDYKKRIPVVARFFKRECPDWVIAYQETPAIVACCAKLIKGKFKLLVSERNTTQTLTIKDRIRFFLYRIADSIVPNSYSQGEYISKHYPHLKHKICVISNFVDLDYFYPVFKKRCTIPLIVIVASVWKPKNALNLIKAAALLKDRHSVCKIDWYGMVSPKTTENKKYHDECFRLMNELDVEDYLSLLPKTSAIADVYRTADYLCLPSYYEGTPNVICEAMSCGRPIICSNVCDNNRYVVENHNGFLFNPSSPESIASKIQEALSLDDNTYMQYCHNSRERAESMLSNQFFLEKYLKITE